MYATKADVVVDIVNSDDVQISGLKYADGASVLLRAAGDRTKNIRIEKTDYTRVKEKVITELGTPSAAVQLH